MYKKLLGKENQCPVPTHYIIKRHLSMTFPKWIYVVTWEQEFDWETWNTILGLTLHVGCPKVAAPPPRCIYLTCLWIVVRPVKMPPSPQHYILYPISLLLPNPTHKTHLPSSPTSLMARPLLFLTSFLLLLPLLLSSMTFPSVIEARPLHMTPINYGDSNGRFEGFSIGAIKHSGPSYRGGGHSLIRLGKLKVLMKDSGPSPGEGHKYITGNHHWRSLTIFSSLWSYFPGERMTRLYLFEHSTMVAVCLKMLALLLASPCFCPLIQFCFVSFSYDVLRKM